MVLRAVWLTGLLASGAAAAAAAPQTLAPRAFTPLPLGQVAPRGWLLEQLVVQANALSGYMAKSTFPGADHVNSSLWVGGDGHTGGGTTQWLPYWTNGNVPLVGLLQAAGAEGRLDKSLDLVGVIDSMMAYVLAHTNKTNGWIGPYFNEPGDANGHGLWDPLNMLRSLLLYAEKHPDAAKAVAAATIAHMTQEAKLLVTDPVIKWAQTRWPTFVEICQYAIDLLVPAYGDDPAVMPLGGAATTTLLLNASALFRAKGMDWDAYYHQTGPIKFPEGPVSGWNTNDHGVNNAEGALRWPAVAYRMSGLASDRKQMDFVLAQIDHWQAQPNALLCADEVFCGRAPHRGTETCAVVEAMASLEMAFTTLGDPLLMDRVERLAFNAMPASLTADMWTHVYVQQANSVFAGHTGPAEGSGEEDPSRRAHHLHYQHQGPDSGGGGAEHHHHEHGHGHGHHGKQGDGHVRGSKRRLGEGCASCGGADKKGLADTPSGEDQTANFFGVSHFPCCITNFPQVRRCCCCCCCCCCC